MTKNSSVERTQYSEVKMNRQEGLSFDLAQLLATLLACCIPPLLAYNRPPSPAALAQCLAIALWGTVAATTFSPTLASRKFLSQIGPLITALAIVAIAALSSWAFGSLPLSLALQAVGVIAGAMLMVASGASAARGPEGPAAFAALAGGLLMAGLASSVVGLIQVFAPGLADDNWIARTNAVGRAVGNMRQPNHLSGLLMWALVAAVALHELRLLNRAMLWVMSLPILFALQLSASRTGATCVMLLLGWAVIDRHLSRTSRWWLAATPLLYAAFFGAFTLYGHIEQRLQNTGVRVFSESTWVNNDPNSRINIWHNTLDMIADQPWAGVGFGEFNMAWTLTSFPSRPSLFFDHCHNLLLQLTVEIGIPATLLVIALLTLALRQGLNRAKMASGDHGLVARAGLMLVILIGTHSMVEYPLWYAYFALPAALAWGFTLGTPPSKSNDTTASTTENKPPKSLVAHWGLLAGLLMSIAGAWSLLDYHKVSSILNLSTKSVELPARIRQAQASILFAHQADYTAAHTASSSPESVELGFARASHLILDPQMLLAWAKHLVARGQVDEARWLLQRMREFKTQEVVDYFRPCNTTGNTLFQCEVPHNKYNWRDFTTIESKINLKK
jgi:O-antigen ligase